MGRGEIAGDEGYREVMSPNFGGGKRGGGAVDGMSKGRIPKQGQGGLLGLRCGIDKKVYFLLWLWNFLYL